MDELQTRVEQAKKSLFFSGARIAEHLNSFLNERGRLCEDIGKTHAGKVRQVFLVGSGGSFASLQTAKYILDRIIDIPSEVVMSYELIWRNYRRLDREALVIFSSYSGETEDTVAGLRMARKRGAGTLAIVGRPESTLAHEADIVIPYANGAIFEIPILAVLLFAFGLVGRDNLTSDMSSIFNSIFELPEAAGRASQLEETVAETKARRLLSADHLYVLGSGPLSPLAYKLAMSVIMENIRIGGTYSDASEWRHGPVEALSNVKANLITLLGTDESRQLTLQTIDFCRRHGSDVLVYDALESANVHPLLTPLVMNSLTQWLVVYSALLRGISDLDTRVFMGHQMLTSTGASWP